MWRARLRSNRMEISRPCINCFRFYGRGRFAIKVASLARRGISATQHGCFDCFMAEKRFAEIITDGLNLLARPYAQDVMQR